MALMYHRVGKGKHTNSLETFRTHFAAIASRYPTLFPGDPLPKKKLSLCLTFDDASFDFYHYLFPLLKEFHIKAVLGVPTLYILEKTTLPPEERLSVSHTLAMQEGVYETKAPFCTWEELEELRNSGLVEIASHSHKHANLTFPFINLEEEVVHSKELLENRLGKPISTFIYPFGKVTPPLHKFVTTHYPYSFRIGSALNWNWKAKKCPLTRLIGDQLTSPTAPFSLPSLTGAFLKNLLT